MPKAVIRWIHGYVWCPIDQWMSMFDVDLDGPEEVEHAAAREVPVVHRQDQTQHEDGGDADSD